MQSLPFLLSSVLLLLLQATTTNAVTDNDIPGCACPTDTTCGTSSQSWLNATVAACVYSDTFFETVLGQQIPVCDALEADPTFQREAGNESYTEDTFTCPGQEEYCDCSFDCTENPEWCSCPEAQACCAGESTGKYYAETIAVMQVATTTCEAWYAEQNSCPLENTVVRKSTPIPLLIRPNDCQGVPFAPLPSNSTLGISAVCETDDRSFDTIAMRLAVVSGEAPDLCDPDTAAGFEPVLTRDDWIETGGSSRRRYMGHDFVDVDGTEYCLFVFSVGNEPCRGPPVAASDNGSETTTVNEDPSGNDPAEDVVPTNDPAEDVEPTNDQAEDVEPTSGQLSRKHSGSAALFVAAGQLVLSLVL